MPQWEYLTVVLTSGKWYINGERQAAERPYPAQSVWATYMQQWGEAGWELVGATTTGAYGEYIFKRPKS